MPQVKDSEKETPGLTHVILKSSVNLQDSGNSSCTAGSAAVLHSETGSFPEDFPSLLSSGTSATLYTIIRPDWQLL
jgi:hypothetical protein